MQYGLKGNQKQNNACIVARNAVQSINGGTIMKFTLNNSLYSVMYDGKNKIALCNGYVIPMKSFKKAQRVYMSVKRGKK